MIRLPERVFTVDPQRARDELAAAWDHLVAAAEHGAGQLGQASRRRATLARERAGAVRAAARGELPASRWRWLGVGLAAGFVVGAVAAAVLSRRSPAGEQAEPGHGALTGLQERAGAVVATAREQASAAAHGAASAARDTADAARETVGKVRDKIGGDDRPEDPVAPPEPPERVP